MPIEQLPIFCYYDVQRFQQYGSMNVANWYGISVDAAKKKQALYPAMGRKHVSFLNQNRLIFNAEPRQVFRTLNFFYVVDGTRVLQYDRFYNERFLGSVALTGNIWYAFLTVQLITYVLISDETNLYLITEDGSPPTLALVTDPNQPDNPQYIAAFGNRFVVSDKDTPNFYLTTIGVDGGVGSMFTINGAALFGTASGIIGQFAVLHAQLYILCSFVTDIWFNTPTQLTVAGVTRTFPWKLNTSNNWDYGIQDAKSLAVGFGRMIWLAQNIDGLVSFMGSSGNPPEDISSQAINVILERSTEPEGLSPFIEQDAIGFIYQYENTIFYRVSAGTFLNFGVLDIDDTAHALEYNFATGTWARVIELNGERNRIQRHVYFNNVHLVTVQADTAMYQMAGNIYHNELRTPDTTAQATDAFTKYPMRYELITAPIFNDDYSEFVDDYVEIDFVFGDRTFYRSEAPFLNTVFVVGEGSTPTVPIYILSEDDKYIIQDGTNTPAFDDNHYNALFKPHIELYYSDDASVTFRSADLREFSPLGEYRWRMRWYELDVSRNRCYKLVCVSSAPIVILGAVRSTRRVSGGGN